MKYEIKIERFFGNMGLKDLFEIYGIFLGLMRFFFNITEEDLEVRKQLRRRAKQ